MLSISLLARWLTKIASLLDFYVTAVVLQSMLRLFSGWASRTPGINKALSRCRVSPRESSMHASTAWILLVRLLSDG